MMGAAATTRIEKGEVPLYMSSWGSYSINDASAILGNFFRGSADDFAGDKELQEWVKEGDTSPPGRAKPRASVFSTATIA